MIPTLESPIQWEWWGISASWTVSSLVVLGIVLCSTSELAKLQKKGYCISTYREETSKSTSTKGGTHKSPCPKENMQKPSHKVEEPCKTSSKSLGTSSPQDPDSMGANKSSHKTKCSPQAKEHKDKHDHKDCNTHSKTKDWPHSDKGNKCNSACVLLLWNATKKSPVLTAPPASQVGFHAPEPPEEHE